MLLFKLSTFCLSSASPERSPLTSVCSTSVLDFFFCRTVLCKLLHSSRFAGRSYLMFFRLVVVPHIDSRTWMIYGRLSIHKMFGTNPVVFAWLPVFPCFRVFSIDRFNPLLSLFRVSFQCWKRIKLKKVRTCTVLTCTMAIMRSAKPLPPFLQLICTATAANDCTNPHFLM